MVAHAWCSTWWWSLCLLIDWFHMTNFTQPYTLFIRVNKIPFRITLSLLLVLLYHLLTQFNLPQSHARLMTFFLPFKFISKTILHMEISDEVKILTLFGTLTFRKIFSLETDLSVYSTTIPYTIYTKEIIY